MAESRGSLIDVRLGLAPSSPANARAAPFFPLVMIVLLFKASGGLLCRKKPPAKPTSFDWTLCCLVWTGRAVGSSASPMLFQTRLESPNQMGSVESTQRPPWKIRAWL